MVTLENRSRDTTRTTLWRSRWAAIGAAVAVSVGAGGIFVAQAAPGPSESTIVSVAPERILDTRNGNDIGLPGPFVSAIAQKLQVTGSIPTATGTKIVVPTGATGVLLNVTPVGPTAAGFIAIRPGDATGAATTSSLNFTAGGISPNSVQVAVPTAGANAGQIDITFDAYGAAGPSTDVLIDVVGYTTNTGLQELVAAQPIARSAREGDVSPDPAGSPRVLVSVTINAPVAGIIQLVGSTLFGVGATDVSVECWLTTGAGNVSNAGALEDTNRADFVGAFSTGGCSTNGALPVAAGTHILNLVSDAPVGVNLDDSTIDALFLPGGTVTATDADRNSDDLTP